MVKSCAALRTVEDAGLILHEDVLVPLDQDRDWLIGDGGFELGDIVRLDIESLSHVDSRRPGNVCLAWAIFRDIRVLRLKHDRCSLEIVYG